MLLITRICLAGLCWLFLAPSTLLATVYSYSGSMHAVIPVADSLTLDVSGDIFDLTYNYPLPRSYLYAVNSQNVTVEPAHSFSPAPDSASVQTDTYGNPYLELTWDAPAAGTISGTVTYTVETTADLDAFVTSDLFPLAESLLPADIVTNYLAAGDEVQSDHADLVAVAAGLASGYDQQWQVVDAVIGWVMDNVAYAVNPAIDALSTYQSGIGVCSNYSHLACALLRAVGIPARYVSGVALSKPYVVPLGNGWEMTTDWGAGSHAWIEVYYPSLGWIPYEPQRDLHHIDTHRITYGAAPQDSMLEVGAWGWSTYTGGSVAITSSLATPAGEAPSDLVFWNTGVVDGLVDEITLNYEGQEDRPPADGALSSLVTFNNSPVIDAGSDQSVKIDTVVSLAGTAIDADGDSLTYDWTITTAPEGGTTTISLAASLTSASFLPDVAGSYVIDLAVSDGIVTVNDTVTVTVVLNTPPVADAGADQTIALVSAQDGVFLNGSDSFDEDGDSITYHWIIESQPDGSAISLSDVSVALPSFMPTVLGTYRFALTVNDNTTDSASDSVTVNIVDAVPLVLAPGWNLMSLPLTPSDTSLESVLGGIDGSWTYVVGYNGSTPSVATESFDMLGDMTSGKGYWIYITGTSNVTLNVGGSAPSTSLTLDEGWNLVSWNGTDGASTTTALSSISSDIEYVVGYDGTIPAVFTSSFDLLGNLYNGKGYWVKVTNTNGVTWNQD